MPSAQLHASSTTSTFVVNYDAGFNANPAAKAAFQAAVDQWSNLITSSVPVVVDASFTALPSGVLGSAGPKNLYANFPGAPVANTWYPVALANARHGSDLDPAHADITATFSSSYPGFYFGTDGNTAGKVDFESVVLHELGHGLGFLGSMNVSGGIGSCGCGGKPFVYDRSVTSNGTPILSFPDNSVALAGRAARHRPPLHRRRRDRRQRRRRAQALRTGSAGRAAAATRTSTRPPTRPATPTRS